MKFEIISLDKSALLIIFLIQTDGLREKLIFDLDKLKLEYTN